MNSDTASTPHTWSRSRLALAALAALTAIRLLVAAQAPLSPDEAYYWVWSRALAPGYLDHPFMVALWIRAGTWIAGDTAIGIRLLAPFAAAFGSLLLADAANHLFPPPPTPAPRPGLRPGLRAAILLNATLLFGVGAVTITPDTPLLFFWTLATWSLARLATHASPHWIPRLWLIVGVASGLALDSKYTAALLGAGIAAWLLTPAMRHHLRTPWPWLGGALAALLFLPPVLWNASHGWASFAKQGSRTESWDPGRALTYVGELLAGQLGLATPLIGVLFAIGVAAALHRWRTAPGALLTALVLPGALVFLQHALGDRVQANWVAILYPGAALAAAGFTTRWWRPAAALGFALTALLYLQTTVAPFTLPRSLDPTLRLAGWHQLASQAQDVAHREGVGFLASEEYGPASLLAWSTGMPVLAAGPRWSFFALPAPDLAEPPVALLLLSARRREPPDPTLWQAAEPLGTLQRRRGDRLIEAFRLYRVIPHPGAPGAILPSRAVPPPATP